MNTLEIMPEVEVAEGMLVRMSAYENPDFPPRREYDPLPPSVSVLVLNLAEAVEACRKYIDTFGLGGGEFGGGWVLDAKSGRPLANVSYNLRVWTPESEWEQRREITVAGRN